jgi:nucleoside-diphosphate-sugar epimerase
MQNKDLIKKILQLTKYKDIKPIFNNISKPGDPFKLVTKNKYFKSIKWKQKINFDKGIKAYAEWFQKKYS